MAGHSKWANIKRHKAVVDIKRGKLFTKASKEIIVAARLGGGDPDGNSRLRMAIHNARGMSMPMDTIRRAILRGTGELEGANIEEVTYEGYGPGGVAIIVEAATENRNRTVADVRAALNKYGGNLGDPGSVSWNFERRGELRVSSTRNEEELLLLGMDAGVDDMKVDEEGILYICSTDVLGSCSNIIASSGITIVESKFSYVAQTMVEVQDIDTAKKLLKLLDYLDDHDDVQNVYNNGSVDDSIVEQILR